MQRRSFLQHAGLALAAGTRSDGFTQQRAAQPARPAATRK
jgi:hypothetical protein